MVKKNFESKKPQEPKSFAAFLKKRAPIYLGLLGLFFVFAYPAITENVIVGSQIPIGSGTVALYMHVAKKRGSDKS